jgi:hypothetical protein
LASGGFLRFANKLAKMGPSNATSLVGSIDQKIIFITKARKIKMKNISCSRGASACAARFNFRDLAVLSKSCKNKRPNHHSQSGL